MALKKEHTGTILLYHSSAIDSQELKSDLESLFSIIVSESLIAAQQPLLFLDATNGHLSFLPYDKISNQTIEGNELWLLLKDLWDDNDNSYDFEEIVSDSLTQALKTSAGISILEQHELFFQDEMGSTVRL